MALAVLIEPTANNHFVAKLGPPFNWSAEGDSVAEALEKLGQETRRQETNGHLIAFIKEPQGEHPLLKWAGTLPDDELTQSWQENIRKSRQAERVAEKTFNEE